MTLPLRIASTVLKAALLVALASGLCLIWIPSGNNYRVLEVFRSILSSSFLVILLSFVYIVVCDALARIQRDSQHNSTNPSDE